MFTFASPAVVTKRIAGLWQLQMLKVRVRVNFLRGGTQTKLWGEERAKHVYMLHVNTKWQGALAAYVLTFAFTDDNCACI